MVTEQELSIVITGLALYLLGSITPNHHPKKSNISFVAGVINTITIGISAFFLPEIFTYLGDTMSSFAHKVMLLTLLTILSTVHIGIRYYGAEERIRNIKLEFN